MSRFTQLQHPLHLAAERGDCDAIRSVITTTTHDIDGRVMVRMLRSWTPLMTAIQNGHVEAALLLVSLAADVHATDRNGVGSTALHMACERNEPRIVKALIEAGANPDCVDAEGCTAIAYAKGKCRAILEDWHVQKEQRAMREGLGSSDLPSMKRRRMGQIESE